MEAHVRVHQYYLVLLIIANTLLSLGKSPVKLNAGLNIAVPGVHTVLKLDMRESSIVIPNLPGYTADNVPIICSGSLFYRVVDSYKACFGVSNVHENVKNTGTSAVRSVLGHFTYDQVCFVLIPIVHCVS